MINTYDYHVAHPDIFKQLTVKDLLFVHYKCPQTEDKVSLYLHHNHIVFTLNGKKIVNHREKSWVLTDNTAVFVRKTAYNQLIANSSEWEVVGFYLQDDFLRQVFKEYRHYLPVKNLPPPPTDMLIGVNVNEATRAFFYSIVPYFTQNIPPLEGLMEMKFKELIVNILSNPTNAHLLAYVASISEQHQTPLREIMEANYTFNLSIAEFARMAHRSEATFKREFQKIYNTTPGKWLLQKRLEYAKMLLDTSNKNITDIAYDSGFENVTHFSRVFKEKHGRSPLQYRNSRVHE